MWRERFTVSEERVSFCFYGLYFLCLDVRIMVDFGKSDPCRM